MRPQTQRGCSYQAPPAGQGLRSPKRGHGSERPPGWALRGPPVRVRLPLTSLGGGAPASPCAAVAALRPTRTASRGPGAERPRRRRELPSEPGAGPACQRRARPLAAVAAAPFCSSFSLLPAARSTPTSGHREARHGRLLHPLPGQPVFSAPPAPLGLGTPPPKLASSPAACSQLRR